MGKISKLEKDQQHFQLEAPRSL